MAAGNAHLSAIVIGGGLIEHEWFVLLRTKVGRDRPAQPPAQSVGARADEVIEQILRRAATGTLRG